MKKLFFCASTMFACVTTVDYIHAQEGATSGGFYGRVNVEYGSGMNLDKVGTTQRVYMEPAGIANIHTPDPLGPGSSEKTNLGTYGSGFTVAITPGYMLSEHIGVELGLHYMIGSETTANEVISTQPDLYSDKTTSKSNQFRILPSLVFSTGNTPIFGFAKVGIVVPAGGSTKIERHILSPELVDETDPTKGMVGTKIDVELESKGKFSLGFRGSVGAGYTISENLSLNLEVFYTSLGIKSKTRSMKSQTVGGQNVMTFLDTYDREIEYVDELTPSSNNKAWNSNADMNKPMQELGSRGNYSQVGVSIGVKYTF